MAVLAVVSDLQHSVLTLALERPGFSGGLPVVGSRNVVCSGPYLHSRCEISDGAELDDSPRGPNDVS